MISNNKVAVITGGARRIGRVIAQHLHSLNFDVAVHYRSSIADAQSLEQELNSKRADSCRIFQADLTQPGEVAVLTTELVANYESIDVLVNNASGFEPTPLETCTVTQFDQMLASNLRAPYFLIRGILPALRSRGGSIVNIVDVHVERPLPQFNAYGAAKAGLASMTRSLAVELAPGIRVNGIAPGAILWPEGDESYDQDARELSLSITPLARMGDPMDIATTVAFLASDAAFITGQIITVDGGRGLVN